MKMTREELVSRDWEPINLDMLPASTVELFVWTAPFEDSAKRTLCCLHNPATDRYYVEVRDQNHQLLQLWRVKR